MTILATLLLLAACSGKTNNNNGSQQGEGRKQTEENVELKIWVAGNSPEIQNTFNSIIDSFNENNESTGLSAKVQFEPWGELDQKLTTALAGGVGPDIFMHGSAAAAGFASNNQVEPLDDYLANWDDTSDYNQGYLDAGMVDDQLYVLPIQGANRMMFYREDIFKEVGVEIPETLDELLEVSEKFVIKEGDRFTRAATTLPTEGNDLQQIWSGFFWSNGGDYFNDDYSEAIINSDAAIKATELYKSFFDQDLTPISGMSGQGDQHPLGTGEVAYTFDGVWAIEQILTYTPDAYDKVKVVAPPKGTVDTTTLVGSSGFFMNANSKNKDEAWELLAFLGNGENIEKISSELKFLPVRESLADSDFVKEDRLFSEFVDLTNTVNGKANPNVPKWTTVRDILADNLESAIYGHSTPEDAIKLAEDEINNVIEQP